MTVAGALVFARGGGSDSIRVSLVPAVVNCLIANTTGKECVDLDVAKSYPLLMAALGLDVVGEEVVFKWNHTSNNQVRVTLCWLQGGVVV